MQRFLTMAVLTGSMAIAAPLFTTQAHAQATQGATGKCVDGTYSRAKTERGACSAHGGVATWFGTGTTEPKAAPPHTTAPKTTTPKSSSASVKRPAGATGECEDGTFTSAATKRGACSAYGGVATWFAESTIPTSEPGSQPSTTATRPSPPVAQSAPSGTTQSRSTTVTTQARPANAPATATAQCNDGTYSFAVHHQGSCSGHHGVKTWFK